jgi:hypothetical protein
MQNNVWSSYLNHELNYVCFLCVKKKNIKKP